MEDLKKFLKKRKDEGALRILKPLDSRANVRIAIRSKEYVDLSSNDYLGLSCHPYLKEAAIKAVRQFGTGSSASRLLSGDSVLCHDLEERTAVFKGKESALVYNSGYQANVGILSALYKKGDAIFADKLSHASILDGVTLSGAKLFRFRHNDTQRLDSLLKEKRKEFKNCLIVTETVFSMDGDEPPLKELVALKKKYDCAIMADEAHATGIFGRTGSGVVERERLTGDIDLIMGTFSKALGSFGAYLAASQEITDYLVNTCRSFIYSTALPPAVVAVNIAALEIIEREPWRREKLLDMVKFFRHGLTRKNLKILGSSQIVPLVVGDNFKAMDCALSLQDKGWWVQPIRPPTVPAGQARLRFSLSTDHGKDILEKLINDISSLGI